MSGKILARASTERPGQVEVVMSDGKDVATTYMTPEQALLLTIDLIAAAKDAQ